MNTPYYLIEVYPRKIPATTFCFYTRLHRFLFLFCFLSHIFTPKFSHSHSAWIVLITSLILANASGMWNHCSEKLNPSPFKWGGSVVRRRRWCQWDWYAEVWHQPESLWKLELRLPSPNKEETRSGTHKWGTDIVYCELFGLIGICPTFVVF